MMSDVPRRRYRSGGLHQRASDGRWIGSIPDGKGGVLRYVTGTNRETVEARMREAAKSSTSPRRTRAGDERLDVYLERWLASRTTLAPRTVESYRSRVTHHIAPAVGRIRLSDLEVVDVQEMVDAVAKTHSAQTAKHCRNILSSALRQAVRWQLVTVNVARAVDAPVVRRKMPKPLPTDQVQAFLDATADDPRHAFYVLAFTTGMRRGEMLALRWEDIDWKRRQVSVNATLRQVSRWRFRRDPTKTERSTRTVPLSDLAYDALKAHQKVAPSTLFVFARPDGRPWPPAEVTREFQARLTAAGLPKIRLHDARHTAAALMLDDNGGDLRAVAATMGHSSIQTTVDVYGGMADAAKRRVAEGMDRTLRRREG